MTAAGQPGPGSGPLLGLKTVFRCSPICYTGIVDFNLKNMGEFAMNGEHAVYIVLTDTGTWFSRMIGWYTGKELNHASLAFDEQLREVYSFGRKKPDNPFSAGFIREDMHGDWFLRRRDVACSIYRCPVSARSLRRIRRYVAFLDRNRMAFTYNLFGLLCVAAGIRFERRRAFFCSQFVAAVLNAGGVRVSDKPACLTTPQDLARSDRLQPVYHGSLRHYIHRVSERNPSVFELDAAAAFPYNRVRTIG